LVGGESVNTNFDIINCAEEADAATTFHETGAHFAIINPSFDDATGWQDVGSKWIPEENNAKHTLVDIEDDSFAATIEGLVAGIVFVGEALDEFFGVLFENYATTENPPDKSKQGRHERSPDRAATAVVEAEIANGIAKGADDDRDKDVS
jgi:hypothetical protein